MELKEIFDFYRKNFKKVVFGVFLFSVLGAILFYVIPVKYVATGSIFVVRAADLVQREEFTYEGFYAQQNASEYSKTVVGILESIEMQKKMVEAKGDFVTEENLRKVRRELNIKKVAPQVITLEIEGDDPQKVVDLWNEVAKQTLSSSETISERGDTGTSIVILDDSPVVHSGFRELWAFVLVGAVFGFVTATFYFALREYLS